MSRRLAALTALPIAASAGGFSAIADGEGRGGSDHPPMLMGSILGSIAVGAVGFAQSFKAQAGHMSSEKVTSIRAQEARSMVLDAYEKMAKA